MSIIDQIRIRTGKRILRRELTNADDRVVVSCNLEAAGAVALMMKITSEEDYSKVLKFTKYLKSEFGTKRIFFFGYWDDAKKDPEFLQTKLDVDYFSKKNLSWTGVPSGGNVDNFLNEKFDILIDLNNYYNVPQRFLVLKSSAKMKVGRYSKENEPFFDVMISTNEADFEEFCNQVVKYLTMIHHKK